MPTSLVYRVLAGEGDRLGADDLTDVRLVAEVELHFAFELQRAVDGRAGADRHDRYAFDAEVEPAVVRLVHQDAPVHSCVAGDIDVAVHGFEAAADVRAVDNDVAIDVGGVTGHVRALRKRKCAVHRLDALGDLRAVVQLDRAVDRVGRFGRSMLTQRNRTVDGGGVFDFRVGLDVDGTIDGVGVRGSTARLHGDRTVDLAHAAVAVVAGDAGGGKEQQRQQDQETRVHGKPRAVGNAAWMLRADGRFSNVRKSPRRSC